MLPPRHGMAGSALSQQAAINDKLQMAAEAQSASVRLIFDEAVVGAAPPAIAITTVFTLFGIYDWILWNGRTPRPSSPRCATSASPPPPSPLAPVGNRHLKGSTAARPRAAARPVVLHGRAAFMSHAGGQYMLTLRLPVVVGPHDASLPTAMSPSSPSSSPSSTG